MLRKKNYSAELLSMDFKIAALVTHMKVSIDKIPLGITEDDVVLGSHLIHFWNTEEKASAMFCET